MRVEGVRGVNVKTVWSDSKQKPIGLLVEAEADATGERFCQDFLERCKNNKESIEIEVADDRKSVQIGCKGNSNLEITPEEEFADVIFQLWDQIGIQISTKKATFTVAFFVIANGFSQEDWRET